MCGDHWNFIYNQNIGFSDILSAGSWHTINDFLGSCTRISDSRPTERNNDNEITMKFTTVTCLGPMWFVGCNLNGSKVGPAYMHTCMLFFFFIYITNVSKAVHALAGFIHFNFSYTLIHDWNKPVMHLSMHLPVQSDAREFILLSSNTCGCREAHISVCSCQ